MNLSTMPKLSAYAGQILNAEEISGLESGMMERKLEEKLSGTRNLVSITMVLLFTRFIIFSTLSFHCSRRKIAVLGENFWIRSRLFDHPSDGIVRGISGESFLLL